MLLRVLERVAVYQRAKGKGGGIWTGLALATFLLRWYQKRAGRDTTVLRQELRPGEAILVTHTTQRHG